MSVLAKGRSSVRERERVTSSSCGAKRSGEEGSRRRSVERSRVVVLL